LRHSVAHRKNEVGGLDLQRSFKCTILEIKELALVAHAYNPSYSGSRDQKDHGLNPALAK
jgi:hypothetical protein